MITYSIIQKSQLEDAHRLDTEYYQQKITELVRKSHEARKKSKELLKEAKRKVEEMIEHGIDK